MENYVWIVTKIDGETRFLCGVFANGDIALRNINKRLIDEVDKYMGNDTIIATGIDRLDSSKMVSYIAKKEIVLYY